MPDWSHGKPTISAIDRPNFKAQNSLAPSPHIVKHCISTILMLQQPVLEKTAAAVTRFSASPACRDAFKLVSVETQRSAGRCAARRHISDCFMWIARLDADA